MPWSLVNGKWENEKAQITQRPSPLRRLLWPQRAKSLHALPCSALSQGLWGGGSPARQTDRSRAPAAAAPTLAPPPRRAWAGAGRSDVRPACVPVRAPG